MFTVDVLAAQQGDAIWIEYGEQADPRRILIDCGTPPTADVVRRRIEALPSLQRRFELLVVTHIDTDHIGGVLRLLANLPRDTEFADVWFNAWRHLDTHASSRLGPIDGEILSVALDKRGWPWNAAFNGGPVIADPFARELRDGMRITVLSPGLEELRKLRGSWRTVIKQAGLDPSDLGRPARLLQRAIRKGVGSSILGTPRLDVQMLAGSPYQADAAVANRSSIALLAEFEGRSCLLTGDGVPDVMLGQIRQLLHERNTPKLVVDAVKVAHHGSRYNTSNDLLATISSSRYLVSTSGAIFGHPDDEALARIVWANRLSGCQLFLNYPRGYLATWSPRKWANASLKRQFRYELRFGDTSGTRVMLAP